MTEGLVGFFWWCKLLALLHWGKRHCEDPGTLAAFDPGTNGMV